MTITNKKLATQWFRTIKIYIIFLKKKNNKIFYYNRVCELSAYFYEILTDKLALRWFRRTYMCPRSDNRRDLLDRDRRPMATGLSL